MDAPTTTAKRKREATDTAAAALDDVSDAEVEEFYAILRRMREASRRLCSGAGAGAGAGAVRAPTRAPAWCPSFSWEDFAPPQPTPAPPQLPAERVAENATPPRTGDLDLNAEPEPESPTTAAAAPATPRSKRVPA